MRLSKLCKIVERNIKFSVVLSLFVAILGTVFSIDKSVVIHGLNQEINEKNKEIEELQIELEKLTYKVDKINEDYNRSSKIWNEEKRKLIEEVLSSKNDHK